MRTTRLYLPVKLDCGNTIQLDGETSNHLIRVLRTSSGAPVILFNGDGDEYLCRTLDNHAKKTSVFIEDIIHNKTESNLSISLFQGLSKLDRMETSIQKSVELGVSKITPVLCSRSNIKLTSKKRVKKLAHWQKVAISACEQSGRCLIPQIEDLVTMDTLKTCMSDNSLRLTLDPESENSIKEIEFSQKNIEIFIGPEGGLTATEIESLKTLQFTNISFGPRILRTETAGPAVISALQVLYGDCG